MANLAECGSLGVRELRSTPQLGLQDAVFGGQIFVARQQLLVHRPRDVGQDPRPIHNGPLLRVFEGTKIGGMPRFIQDEPARQAGSSLPLVRSPPAIRRIRSSTSGNPAVATVIS